MKLTLSDLKPFAKGGNRLCFIHPENVSKCVKVRRPDFTLEDLRKKKGFPKNLKPLSSFDDNLEEHQVMIGFGLRYGREIYQHVSECFGFEDTDLGKGLVSELIRDESGQISYSLKQYLWECGRSDSFDQAVEQLCDFWETLMVPSRDLLLHNIVAQRDKKGEILRLVVIDGLGSPNLIPSRWWPKSHQRKKIRRKIQNLRDRIESYIVSCESGKVPSQMGQLIHKGLDSSQTEHK